MTLYDDLHVKPDADPAVIKKAYRKRARETHPDKGGDTASFQAVAHAYEVLSDPARRSHYDKTGDHGQAGADTERQTMLSFLAQFVLNVVVNAPSVKTIDVLASVKVMLGNEVTKLQTELGNIRRQQERVADAGKRFKRRGDATGDDLVHMLLDGQMQHIERGLNDLNSKVAFMKRLSELMDTYTYTTDPHTIPASYIQTNEPIRFQVWGTTG